MKPLAALSCLILAAASLPAQRYESASLPMPQPAAGRPAPQPSPRPVPDSLPRPRDIDTGVYEAPMDVPDSQAAGGQPLAAGSVAEMPPEPQIRYEASLELVRDDRLLAKVETADAGRKFLAILIADVDDGMVSIPGLGTLLETEIVLGSMLGVGALHFDFGRAKLPFDVFLQGIAVSERDVAFTSVEKLAAGH